jgi:hypothetical protein
MLLFHSICTRRFSVVQFSPMANDHFVPRAYLRGFTPEYLTGKRGTHVVVYSPSFGTSKRLSMNNYVACEPEFYDKHPIDKHWSRTIEQSWPALRESLKRRATDAKTLDQLFWFVAAQMMRTHSYMNRVAHFIALRDAKRIPVVNQGRTGTGVFMNMADTGEVMDVVLERWPKAREALETDYVWTVYHNSFARRFLTGDDPCQWNPATEAVVMPLALDMALLGRITKDREEPSFRHSDASAEIIAKVNRTVVRGCNSFFYAHEETEELRRFARKHYVGRDVVFGGRSFTNEPGPFDKPEIERFLEHFNKLRQKEET